MLNLVQMLSTVYSKQVYGVAGTYGLPKINLINFKFFVSERGRMTIKNVTQLFNKQVDNNILQLPKQSLGNRFLFSIIICVIESNIVKQVPTCSSFVVYSEFYS